ncbi:MAG: hypothetical protein AB1499_15570, partial [Nitrospirota bacterium]
IAGGWWGTIDPISINTTYSWSIHMDIDPSDSSNPFLVIGDGLYYGSVGEVETARTNNYLSYTQQINFGGGDIRFFINDDEPRNKLGTISTAFTIVPEPVSSTLFILGGAVFAGRRLLRKKIKD